MAAIRDFSKEKMEDVKKFQLRRNEDSKVHLYYL